MSKGTEIEKLVLLLSYGYLKTKLTEVLIWKIEASLVIPGVPPVPSSPVICINITGINVFSYYIADLRAVLHSCVLKLLAYIFFTRLYIS